MLNFEGLLTDSVAATDPNISEVALHLIKAGGKRIRPTLAIATAAAGNVEVNRSILLAGVAVELVHLASLYHDDVMDEAAQRRNVVSVNAKWGNLTAIVVGDFLLARAAGIAARLGQDTAELLANTLARLCEGQILEVNSVFKTNRTIDQYFEAISGKTASLMASSCKIGALTAKLDEELTLKLERIGYLFGIVYQVRDDILDLVATSQQLGKVPAQDLMEGVYTLPTILALADESNNARLSSILNRNERGTVTAKDIELARNEILGSGVLEKSVAIARNYCDEAAEIASSIGNPVATFLGKMPASLLNETEIIVDARLNS